MTPVIPFLDLVPMHRDLEEELVAAFRGALRDAAFVGGPAVSAFEQDFAHFCSTRACVAVSSGTDALRFALNAAGVLPGDTVVTVPNTFIATTEAISQVGATPMFVDVDPHTYTMDVSALREYLEGQCSRDRSGHVLDRRTGSIVRAVVPVHLYGQMADMDGIQRLALAHDLLVIEDACQAHGAEYLSDGQGWLKAGAVGHAAAFSFYPGKNLGACGEGGAVTTNDGRIAERCRRLRDHGQSRKYVHEMEGYNGRLDAIQAAILKIKLQYLETWNEQRRMAAAVYDALLADVPDVRSLHVPAWSRPVYHLYVVAVESRDRLQEHLATAGVGTGIHYPMPLHLSPPYQKLGFKRGDFPVAEAAASALLSLPMFPGLTLEQQHEVCDAIRQFSPRAATVSSASV